MTRPEMHRYRVTLLLVLALCLWGAGSARAQTPTPSIEYYHLDALGSVRVVTDYAGVEIRRRELLPFGEEWTEDGTPGPDEKRLFTGKERDTETGLDYFGARYYRADIGRFTTIDPVYTWQENLTDPQRWNRYAYVRNNPLKYVDPDGRWIETLWDIANVVMGAKSAVDNFRAGNILSGVVDTGGAIVDLAAAVVPVVPGGVGTAIKAARAVERVDDALDAKKVISLSKARYGEAAQHAEDAIRAGQPAVLTVDRAGAAANRSASIGGRPKVRGKQLDEYPPAMFREGGAGASVRPVNPRDNMAAGACIGNACRVLPDGTRVRIEIVK